MPDKKKLKNSTPHFSTFQGNYTFTNLVIDESFLPNVIPRGESYILSKVNVDEKPAYAVKLSMIVTYRRN